jgi:Mce-associated membrane protein
MSALWWRRVTSYLLRIVLPASLLSQLVGSVLFERSSPGGFAESWIAGASVVVACVISAWSTRNG